MHGRALLVTAAALSGCLLSGCGSTVPPAQRASADRLATTADGLGGSTAGASAPMGGSSTTAAGSAPVGTSGAQVTAGAPQIADQAGAAQRGPGSGRVRGVSTGSITIGAVYVANAGAANAALGGKGITTGNEPADLQAVLDDVNRHGGLAGRKLVPLLRQRDGQSTDPVASQAQAECSFFTQDHKVFAVFVGNGPVDWALKPCLNKAGVPAITSHIASLDDDRGRTGINVDVAGMNEADLAAAQLATIAHGGWLGGWNAATGAAGPGTAKVGLLSYDLPQVNHAVDDVLLPGLARLGAKVDTKDVFRIAIPQSSGDDGAAAAAIQNTVLRLRNDGVDHVVLVDNGGAMTLLFANDAYSQHYLPRYAGTSSNGFQALLSAGDIQPAVLAGAIGAGWEPLLDLPPTTGAAKLSAAGKACQDMLAKAGLTFSDVNSKAVAFGYCDKASLLVAAVGTRTTSEGAFVDGVNSLSRFASARGLGSRFSAGRHDGGSSFYSMAFDGACSCFTYTGSEQAL